MMLMISVVNESAMAVAEELRPLIHRLDRKLQRETEQFGVTGRQVALLWQVRRRPGISIGELAELEGVSAAALSVHVDRLASLGLVERSRSGEDRRRVGLVVTRAAVRLLRRVRAARTTWLATRMERLSDEQLAALHSALPALAGLLDEETG
jgi:DNA-binding MarR family transcriptional regulator